MDQRTCQENAGEVIQQNESFPKNSEKAAISNNQHGESSSSPLEDSERPYTALVNEECQKHRLSLPNYEIFEENCNSITKFRCHARDFLTFPDFRSNASTSKRAAKNEAAKRIYEWMNKIESSNTPALAPTSSLVNIFEISADFVAFDEPHTVNYSSEEPAIDPKIMIPYVMTLLTQLSKSCHPKLSPIDGIYELIDQWKEFLDWKDTKN